MTDDQPAAPNNPAGRVLAFLRDYESIAGAISQTDTAMSVLMKMLNKPQESPGIYLTAVQLWVQAVSVPSLMDSLGRSTPGYGRFVQHYGQIIQATKMLSMPHQYAAPQILGGVTDGGWFALEIADDVLSLHAAERSLTEEQQSEYLTQVRKVIDAVAGDESLSPFDRSRLVQLLRKVERALLDIRINGALPVQEAAAAAGAIVAVGHREQVSGRVWLTLFYRVLGGIVLLLQGVDSGIAINEYVQDMIGDGTEDVLPTATHGEPSDEIDDVPGGNLSPTDHAGSP